MGGLFLTGSPLPTPNPSFGFDLWLDPSQLLASVSLVSAPDGSFSLAVPLTGLTSGGPIYAQSVWLPTPTCSGPSPAAASHPLAITLR